MFKFKLFQYLLIFLFLGILSSSCDDDGSKNYEFFPLSVGSYWVYANSDDINGVLFDTVRVEGRSIFYGKSYFKLTSSLDSNYSGMFRYDSEFYYSLIDGVEYIILAKNLKVKKEVLIENPENRNFTGACLDGSDGDNIDMILNITGEEERYTIGDEFRIGYRIYYNFFDGYNQIESVCEKNQYYSEGIGLIYTEWLVGGERVAYSKLVDYYSNK